MANGHTAQVSRTDFSLLSFLVLNMAPFSASPVKWARRVERLPPTLPHPFPSFSDRFLEMWLQNRGPHPRLVSMGGRAQFMWGTVSVTSRGDLIALL